MFKGHVFEMLLNDEFGAFPIKNGNSIDFSWSLVRDIEPHEEVPILSVFL